MANTKNKTENNFLIFLSYHEQTNMLIVRSIYAHLKIM